MNTIESRLVSKTSSKQMGLILPEFVILASNACSGRVSIGANTCAVHHGVVGFFHSHVRCPPVQKHLFRHSGGEREVQAGWLTLSAGPTGCLRNPLPSPGLRGPPRAGSPIHRREYIAPASRWASPGALVYCVRPGHAWAWLPRNGHPAAG